MGRKASISTNISADISILNKYWPRKTISIGGRNGYPNILASVKKSRSGTNIGIGKKYSNGDSTIKSGLKKTNTKHVGWLNVRWPRFFFTLKMKNE